ncbi:unnamed protein product [Closterium sp. NIES-65]|nr:unnamed protein product [Closterium sp. NIES-65]
MASASDDRDRCDLSASSASSSPRPRRADGDSSSGGGKAGASAHQNLEALLPGMGGVSPKRRAPHKKEGVGACGNASGNAARKPPRGGGGADGGRCPFGLVGSIARTIVEEEEEDLAESEGAEGLSREEGRESGESCEDGGTRGNGGNGGPRDSSTLTRDIFLPQKFSPVCLTPSHVPSPSGLTKPSLSLTFLPLSLTPLTPLTHSLPALSPLSSPSLPPLSRLPPLFRASPLSSLSSPLPLPDSLPCHCVSSAAESHLSWNCGYQNDGTSVEYSRCASATNAAATPAPATSYNATKKTAAAAAGRTGVTSPRSGMHSRITPHPSHPSTRTVTPSFAPVPSAAAASASTLSASTSGTASAATGVPGLCMGAA